MLQEEFLKKILEGNKRFAQGKSVHPNLGGEVRSSLINGQTPFAAILACSDSRVPIEIILDAGLGDIFVVRNAGNIVSDGVVGSFEYAVKNLGVGLIMIIGHGDCGAVKSALNIYETGESASLTKNLKCIFNHINPSIIRSAKEHNGKMVLNDIIKLNTKMQAENLLTQSSYLSEKIKAKEVMIVCADYCLNAGLIEIL